MIYININNISNEFETQSLAAKYLFERMNNTNNLERNKYKVAYVELMTGNTDISV